MASSATFNVSKTRKILSKYFSVLPNLKQEAAWNFRSCSALYISLIFKPHRLVVAVAALMISLFTLLKQRRMLGAMLIHEFLKLPGITLKSW